MKSFIRDAILIIVALALTILLAARADSQTLPKSNSTWQWTARSVYSIGSATDIAYSVGKQEANPLFRTESGRFNVAANVAMSTGIGAAFELLDSRYPERRRTIRGIQIGVGVARFCVGFFHNRSVRRMR